MAIGTERQSLRSFLATVPEEDLLTLELPRRDFLLSALVQQLEGKKRYPIVQLVEPGTGQRTVANVFANRERLNQAIHNITTVATAAERFPAPKRVAAGTAQQVVLEGSNVDVEALPVFRHFADDAGRYISSGIIIARDPETGRCNMSFHRMQLKGRNSLATSLHSRGDLWRYFNLCEAQGRDLEIAVVIGCHPAYYIAGASKIPPTQDDYSWVSAYLDETAEVVPAKTVDIPVPANAEYVLEGRLKANVRVDEGPFGEYTGYSTSRSTRNLFEVSCITRRQDAIYQDLIPGSAWEHLLLSQYTKEIILLDRLKGEFPEVTALCLPKNGCHFHAYLAMDPSAPGQARLAMMMLFGLDHYLKLIVVVNSDINVYNDDDVLWAMATRMQADKDIFVVPGVLCNRLDPSSSEGMSAKMGITALSADGQENKRISLPDDVQQEAAQLLWG